MTWDEVSGRIKEALQKEAQAEIVLAMTEIMGDIKIDYEAMASLATQVNVMTDEIEHYKKVTAEYARKTLSDTDEGGDEGEDESIVYGDAVIEEIKKMREGE